MCPKPRHSLNRRKPDVKQTAIITLLTDFGLQDEYVAVMKGVILSINRSVDIVDITHNITRHDIRQAALTISSSFRYFPKGSVHVIVVDPGVGGKRNIICLRQEGHFFVAPDNGVLTMVIQGKKIERVCAVTNQKYFLDPVSHTFHGRDIFAPIAAHLSKGVDMRRFGGKVPPEDVTRLEIPTPSVSARNELIGTVISIDHFGNLVTNISQANLDGFRGDMGSAEIEVRLGKFKIRGVSTSYENVKPGAPLAIVGSRQLLEISVNQGDARAHFKSRIGQAVKVN